MIRKGKKKGRASDAQRGVISGQGVLGLKKGAGDLQEGKGSTPWSGEETTHDDGTSGKKKKKIFIKGRRVQTGERTGPRGQHGKRGGKKNNQSTTGINCQCGAQKKRG